MIHSGGVVVWAGSLSLHVRVQRPNYMRLLGQVDFVTLSSYMVMSAVNIPDKKTRNTCLLVHNYMDTYRVF